jgi:hypothetical protein
MGNGASILACAAYDTGTNTTMRMLLNFALDWTDVSTITSAILTIHSGNVYAYFNPTVSIQRNTSSWSEGTYVDGTLGLSDGNAVNWGNKPSVTEYGAVTWNPGVTHSSWCSVDITNIVKAWAPSATVTGGGDESPYGITIKAATEGIRNNNWDASTKDASGNYGAYITLTYNDSPDVSSIDDWQEITGDYYPWKYYANLYDGQCKVWDKGLQVNPLNDQAVEPSNDCFASLIELKALREVIPMGTILPLALQRIDNNSNQITYYKSYTAGDTVTTAAGYRKFEPGGTFSKFGVTWSGAAQQYTTFFDDDCNACYPDGFHFGIVDHRNNMVFESDKESGYVTMSGGL